MRLRYRVVANCRGTCIQCGGKGDAVYVCMNAPEKWRKYLCNECLIEFIQSTCQAVEPQKEDEETEDVGIDERNDENTATTGMDEASNVSVSGVGASDSEPSADADTDGRVLQEVLADADGGEDGPDQGNGGSTAKRSGNSGKKGRGKGRKAK